MTRYSIAEARANLPTIVDAVAVGDPVEITRRGKPVAVVLSRAQYDAMTMQRTTFAEAYRAFQQRFDLGEVGLDADFAATVRAKESGRKVVL